MTDANMQKMRSSNLELYRIVCMLFIVAHHYVVNSGLLDVMASDNGSYQKYFLYCFGAWGKTAINCFVFITGYFMCKSGVTIKKLVKLLFEIYFYSIVITLIFLITGYVKPTISVVGFALLPAQGFMHNFCVGYIFLFLSIPFLNILVFNLNKKQHLCLVILFLFVYTIWGSIPKVGASLDYSSWFPALYIIASYIRIYDTPIKLSHKQWGMVLIISILLACVSILFFVIFVKPAKFDFLLNESNKIFALSTSFASFMWFKDLNIRNSLIINTISSSTFGVLLIHANSDIMRQWLWRDVFHVVDRYYNGNLIYHLLISIFIIYIVCTIIDQLRIHFIEKPVFKFAEEKHWL